MNINLKKVALCFSAFGLACFLSACSSDDGDDNDTPSSSSDVISSSSDDAISSSSSDESSSSSEAATLELLTLAEMGTGTSAYGSYLDLDSMKVYKQGDVSTSISLLNNIDLVFGGGADKKIASPMVASDLNGIWSGISDFSGMAQLFATSAGAWEGSEEYADIANYFDKEDPILNPISVSVGDVFVVLTTESEYMLIRVEDVTAGIGPVLSLKVKRKG